MHFSKTQGPKAITYEGFLLNIIKKTEKVSLFHLVLLAYLGHSAVAPNCLGNTEAVLVTRGRKMSMQSLSTLVKSETHGNHGTQGKD